MIGQKDAKSRSKRKPKGRRRRASPQPPITVDPILAEKMKTSFDWRAYLEMNSDLIDAGLQTQVLAEQHYIQFGQFEGRLFPNLHPDTTTMITALSKLDRYLADLAQRPLAERVLVIHHIGWPSAENSLEVTLNNMKYFHQAVASDSLQAHPKAFYWINIIGGSANPLFNMVGKNFSNVAQLHWVAAPSDMYLHFRTMMLLETKVKQFQLVMCLNNEVRGPFALREHGKWLDRYLALLNPPTTPPQQPQQQSSTALAQTATPPTRNVTIGLVGSTLSCELSPHIQTHIFGLNTALLDGVLDHFRSYHPVESWMALIRHYEVGLSTLVRKLGGQLSSLLYGGMFTKCIKPKNRLYTEKNPSRWCDVNLDDLLFVKYGGKIFRIHGYICKELQQKINNRLFQEQDQGFVYPEAINGGRLLPIYRDFALEQARDRNHAYFNSFMHYTEQPQEQLSARDVLKLQALNGHHVTPATGPGHRSVCVVVKCCAMDSKIDPQILHSLYGRMYQDIFNASSGHSPADMHAYLDSLGVDVLTDMLFAGHSEDTEQLVTKLIESKAHFPFLVCSAVCADCVCLCVPVCVFVLVFRCAAISCWRCCSCSCPPGKRAVQASRSAVQGEGCHVLSAACSLPLAVFLGVLLCFKPQSMSRCRPDRCSPAHCPHSPCNISLELFHANPRWS